MIFNWESRRVVTVSSALAGYCYALLMLPRPPGVGRPLILAAGGATAPCRPVTSGLQATSWASQDNPGYRLG